MALIDQLYKKLATTILSEGFSYTDPTRANVELIQIPSYQLSIPIEGQAFPLLTTKKVWWKGVLVELLWILSGSIDTSFLNRHNVHIWDEDAKNFSGKNIVGRVYGAQWRTWAGVHHGGFYTPHVDQITALLKNLKTHPFSRRHIVTAWNPAELDDMALPPCFWSFEVIPDQWFGKIGFTLKWHQRSVDTFLGLPFDIASHAFLGKLIEASTGYTFKHLIGDLSNVHFYKPHLPQVEVQLNRDTNIQGPNLELLNGVNLLNAKLEDFKINNYKPQAALKAKLFTQTTL